MLGIDYGDKIYDVNDSIVYHCNLSFITVIVFYSGLVFLIISDKIALFGFLFSKIIL